MVDSGGQAGELATASKAALSAVEITPEMIEAGLVALREWVPVDEGRFSGWDRFAVRDVFLAMSVPAKPN
jgi:hypothetical protein